jgi:DNA sulfur modification protein DndB
LIEQGAASFEPLGDFTDVKNAYKPSASKIGFLTLQDGEHIALDGQHRIAAIQMVIQGKRSGLKLEPGKYSRDVPTDEMCVLIVEHESDKKTRTIFNKVNRHAKPTSRSDNIIMDQDDGNAIVARMLLEADRGSPLANREIGTETGVVNWKVNTLGQHSKALTTLASVYETVCDILEDAGDFGDFPVKGGKDADPVSPSDERLEEAYEIVLVWWEELMKLDIFVGAVSQDLANVPDLRADRGHRQSLLLKPAGLQAIVQGMIWAVRRSNERGPELTIQEATKRVNRLDLSYDSVNAPWRGTVVRADGAMVSRKEKKVLAANLVAYLIGVEFMSDEEIENLWAEWNKARGRDPEADVSQMSEEEAARLLPEDLPQPLSS